MWKKAALIIFALMILASIGYAGISQDIKVQFTNYDGRILGRDVEFSEKPFIYDDELYVHLDEAAELFGPISYTEDGIPVLGRQLEKSLYELIEKEVDGWISLPNSIYWRETIVGGVEYPFAYRKYMRGIHSAPISIVYRLDESYSSFFGQLGIEDLSQVKDKPVIFRVYGDGTLLYEKIVAYGESAVAFNIDITGVDALKLEMSATDDEKTGILALIDPQLKVKF